MHVHADDDFGTLEFVECMLDAVGDIGCDADLRLRHHIGGCGKLTAMIQQLSALFLLVSHILVIIHYVQADQSSVQFLVSHQEGETHQIIGIFRILHRYENLLIACLLGIFGIRKLLVAEDNLSGTPVGEHRRDDAGAENHHHHTIQHVIVHQIGVRTHQEVHTHHHHGDTAGGMGRSQTEHHVTR